MHKERINQLLSTVGDGSGVTEMATTAAVYQIIPASNEIYKLERMLLYIEDLSFRADFYGATAALTNGIIVTKEDGSGVIDTLTPEPIKKLYHWGLVSGIDVETSTDPGNDATIIRWTFSKGGGPLILDGRLGHFLKFNVQDSLAALDSQLANIQGTKIIIDS